MPAYRYRAVHASGHIQQGQMFTANENELIHLLNESGLELIEAKPERNKPVVHRLQAWRDNPTMAERILFCSQMEDLLRAGTPFLAAIKVIISVMSPSPWRNHLDDIARDVSHGTLIGTAFGKQSALFDKVFIAILVAGEASGDLITTFNQLTQQLRWQSRMQELFRRALRYPLFLLCVAVGVTTFMMMMVVPQIVTLLNSIDSHLPLLTHLLINVSEMFATGWWIVFLAIISGVFAVVAARRFSESVALKLDRSLLAIPGLGPTLYKLAIARFVYSFTILQRSGVDLPTSLRIASAVLGNRALIAETEQAQRQVLAGQAFSVAMTGLFPPFVTQMLRIGESSGQLPKTLEEINRFYDSEVTATVERFIGALEPALTILVGSILAWVVLAVLGPVYGNLDKITQVS